MPMSIVSKPSTAILAVGLAVLTSLTAAATHGRDANAQLVDRGREMPAVDIEKRGKELRREIDKAYRGLVETGQLKNQGVGRNLITDVVARYIPPGTSFLQAEEILRAAGFAVEARVPNNYLPEAERYDERATIDNYVPMTIGKTSVTVLLRPRSANDYSVVQSIVAEVTRTLP